MNNDPYAMGAGYRMEVHGQTHGKTHYNVTEKRIVELIEEWRMRWYNEDKGDYRERAGGVDANMIYDLARKIAHEVQTR